ncbi:DNA modification methylase [Hyphomicrobium sp. MC1]|uniref:DNA modification methylase n=1 Tax=Hyphomicrobium sp. (strain MC1) TaxID=717785 RepID=UPI000213EB7F|nr:DNA modification methylase [Hyphomicrobium sp. MC1]CCB66634.1 DNA methylase N-4/N-6 domain protein [Hyphomicrobium sp. MC1]
MRQHSTRTRSGVLDPLKAKSRQRRKQLAGLSASGAQAGAVRNDLLPKLQLVERAPAEIIVPARNVRDLDSAHVRETASAVLALGFSVPILIDHENNLVDGAVRLEAAKLLGLARVPCIVISHLSSSERRLLRIAMNRLQEKGDWDLDSLKIELQELILEDAPIEITGFSLPEIDQILLDDDIAAIEQGLLVPEQTIQPVARVGDHFILGRHEIICGDATDSRVLERLMHGHQARLLLTDEPYNVKISGNVTRGAHREFVMASGEMSDREFHAFNDAWMAASRPHLCDGALFGTFIDWRGYPTVHAAATALGLNPVNLIVWVKSNAGMGSQYRSQHELLPLFKIGTAPHVNNIELGKHGRWRSNIWTYPGASSMGSDARRGLQDHPTVKPVAMLEDALLDMTNRDDIALDPFLGSGSTLIAAEKTGRCCRGLELDPRYVDVILRRYYEVTGEQGILREMGETFDELAERRMRETESPE